MWSDTLSYYMYTPYTLVLLVTPLGNTPTSRYYLSLLGIYSHIQVPSLQGVPSGKEGNQELIPRRYPGTVTWYTQHLYPRVL